MINLILLGDPASGKTTQARKLVKKFNFAYLDMGEQLRAIKVRFARGDVAALKKTIDKGALAPTRIVRHIFRKFIESAPKSKGLFFSSAPKMIGEAKFVHNLLQTSGRSSSDTIFLYLRIPRSEIIKRSMLRGKKEGRKDDSPEAIKKRIAYGRGDFKKVVKFFRQKYYSKDINGMRSVAQVHKSIIKEINEFISKKQKRHRNNP